MIVILTGPADPHADAVIERLARAGADYLRINEAEFPAQMRVSYGCTSAGHPMCTLHTADRRVDLDRVSVIWQRRPLPPVAHASIQDPSCRAYVEAECKDYLESVWYSLSCEWVPARPTTTHRAGHKPTQLQLAGELGFEVPPTLITNDPEEFLAFYREHGGSLISKLGGSALVRSLRHLGIARYTQQVTRRDVGYADDLRYSPVIFQAYVPKRLELRVTVVGDRVFAAEIHSQRANRTQIDWRRYDLSHTPHYPHVLPEVVERRCADLVQRLGLCYGAIDLILTPDGRYVFLEINPNGQYLWIEHLTRLPISDALCDLLLSRDSHSPGQRSTSTYERKPCPLK
jgi:hypothetical protein